MCRKAERAGTVSPHAETAQGDYLECRKISEGRVYRKWSRQFLVVSGDRTRDSGHKPKHRNIKNSFYVSFYWK